MDFFSVRSELNFCLTIYTVMNVNVQQQQRQQKALHSPGEYLEVQDEDTEIQ